MRETGRISGFGKTEHGINHAAESVPVILSRFEVITAVIARDKGDVRLCSRETTREMYALEKSNVFIIPQLYDEERRQRSAISAAIFGRKSHNRKGSPEGVSLGNASGVRDPFSQARA